MKVGHCYQLVKFKSTPAWLHRLPFNNLAAARPARASHTMGTPERRRFMKSLHRSLLGSSEMQVATAVFAFFVSVARLLALDVTGSRSVATRVEECESKVNGWLETKSRGRCASELGCEHQLRGAWGLATCKFRHTCTVTQGPHLL